MKVDLLEGVDLEYFTHLLDVYVDGLCYFFALAMEESFGWKIKALMEGEVVRHAFLETPEGRYFDARGFLDLSDIVSTFTNPASAVVQDITRESLEKLACAKCSKVQYVYEIKKAQRMAQIMWPELAWKDSHLKKIQCFLEGLEVLSRECGVYLYGSIAPTLSVLDDGTEVVYSAQQLPVGFQFSLKHAFVPSLEKSLQS